MKSYSGRNSEAVPTQTKGGENIKCKNLPFCSLGKLGSGNYIVYVLKDGIANSKLMYDSSNRKHEGFFYVIAISRQQTRQPHCI